MNFSYSELLKNIHILEAGFADVIIVNAQLNVVHPEEGHAPLYGNHPYLYPHRKKIATILQEKETQAWESLETRSAEGMRYLNLKITPLFDQPDTLEGLLIQISDQTANKKSLVDMEKRLDDMEKTTTAKSQFLANMSHELRSPMTSVIGMSHLLLETELDAEQRECAEVIHGSSTGLLNLINDTLDFSKLDAGKVQLESIPFNLYALVSQVCKGFKIQCDQKGTYIILDYFPDCHQQFRGDPGRFRQILNNFTSNAVKFTKEGGIKIEITKLSSDENQETIKITVHDTGMGMSPEVLGRIFKKFVQADDSTTRKFGGTGLGLAISKELAELMGGEVGVDSEPGKGSSFWLKVTLPFEKDENERLKRANIKGKKVLVIDGNPSILAIQSRNLLSSGLQCETSENAHDAIKVLVNASKENKPFDALVTDFTLPDMDGAELGHLIKGDSNISTTHLIMLTSMGKKGDSKRMHDAGYDAYLVKPTEHNILLEIIACSLARKDSNEELITKYTLSEETTDTNLSQADKKKAYEEAKKAKANKNLAPVEVLIAEDDPMIQKMMKKLMKKFNQPYCLVDNGEDAYQKAITGNYPLILMDWHMPILDGLQATQKIREFEGENRKTWVIALTAGGASDVKTKCLAAGMDDHLPKPFEIDVFKKVLESGIDIARQLNPS